MQKIRNFIRGEWAEPASGQYVDNFNPSRGTVYSWIPRSNSQDVELAITAAEEAFPAWSQTSVEKRVAILRKMAAGILTRLDSLALAESQDNGKPISVAKSVDIPRSARNFEFFADAVTQFHGETFMSDNGTMNYTDHSALGVVACISPWNLPLYLLTWKIAPALAMGNTVVAKPSEVTPMTAFILGEVAQEAGLPAGVLNIIHGTGPEVGDPLVKHPKIKAVSFTGSTATGRSIASGTAHQFKKLALEMGGKNPNIVFADCDREKAISESVRAAFSNQGQICLCGSRIFIERPFYEEFRKKFVEQVEKIKLGDPMLADTQMGALVSKSHMEKVLSYIELAKIEGGKILTGGCRALMTGELSEGYFVQPTVVENLDFRCRVNQEEIFGPVVTLTPFDSEEQVLEMANSTVYGLAASVWTTNLQRAHRMAKKIDSGIVWINCWMLRDLRTPFGGMKESGMGREGGMEALKFFSEVKNICIAMQ